MMIIANDLLMQGAGASAAMVLTYFWYIPILTPEGLTHEKDGNTTWFMT